MFAINLEVLGPSWAKLSHMVSIAAHCSQIRAHNGPQLLRLRKVLELRDFLETWVWVGCLFDFLTSQGHQKLTLGTKILNFCISMSHMLLDPQALGP